MRVSTITAQKPPTRFMTIDASTHSLAFAIVENGSIVEHGKLLYSGDNLDEKLNDIAHKTYIFMKEKKIQYVVIEDTVYINSTQTVTVLSKCQGALLAAAYLAGVKHTYKVSPISWQSYIGTRLFTKDEKLRMRQKFPNKSAAWYKAKERQLRKQKTIDTVNKRFNLSLTDDDIADSCGIAMFCMDQWPKILQYGKK